MEATQDSTGAAYCVSHPGGVVELRLRSTDALADTVQDVQEAARLATAMAKGAGCLLLDMLDFEDLDTATLRTILTAWAASSGNSFAVALAEPEVLDDVVGSALVRLSKLGLAAACSNYDRALRRASELAQLARELRAQPHSFGGDCPLVVESVSSLVH